MKYLVLLIGEGDAGSWEAMTAEQQGAEMEKFEAFGGPDTMTVMRTRAGAVSLTDGPYAESVEQLGGFYLVEAPDLDTLVDLLRLLPAYDIQISPVVDIEA